MPTPANALFWGSFIVGQHDKLVTKNFNFFGFLSLIGLIMITSWLLICEIPMFSLKFKNLSWGENKLRFFFLGASSVLVVLMGLKSFAPIISMYVLLAIIVPLLQRKK